MSLPRQVLPNQFYLITRRCTQRMFLMRPDEQTTNAFLYCLAEAARRFKIEILMTTAESNHHHTVIFDRKGHCPKFIEHFHKMFARCQNARLGRWENLWSSAEPSVTALLDRKTVIDKMVYAAANPVKDSLVERATQWPGANGYRCLQANRPLQIKRPNHFFSRHGSMPREVTFELTIPAELGSLETVANEVREGVEQIEAMMRAKRSTTGGRILGRRTVLRQPWTASPTTEAKHRGLRPRFAGAQEVRIAALQAYRLFLVAYREAREIWRRGLKAVFPSGTYQLACNAPIEVSPPRD